MSTTTSLGTSLGQKHTCGECSAKFYDMNKAAPSCPKCAAPVPVAPPARVLRHAHLAAKPAKPTTSNVKTSGAHVEHAGFKTGEIDTIDTLEEDDDILISLSELEDRENSDRPETDDDVHEEDLMEDMKNYDTILDDAEEEGEGDEEAHG